MEHVINPDYLYFPECKIIKAQIVPKSVAVIMFYLKTVKNSPKHYPKHSLLEGKVEFTFGLELSEHFKDTKSSNFFSVFECNWNVSPSRLIGKKVSSMILFQPDAEKKLDTIGLGSENELITIYNDMWTPKEIKSHSQIAKLNYNLPPKNTGKEKRSKI